MVLQRLIFVTHLVDLSVSFISFHAHVIFFFKRHTRSPLSQTNTPRSLDHIAINYCHITNNGTYFIADLVLTDIGHSEYNDIAVKTL